MFAHTYEDCDGLLLSRKRTRRRQPIGECNFGMRLRLHVHASAFARTAGRASRTLKSEVLVHVPTDRARKDGGM